ncbi:MAG: RagB/SusD family nutrient uptake outer membrane protein [Bacteroidales bacterium]|jgi:hypothetical protein|nr:RagB/SusD family nutrient uptake outer membrane protein [Bacteroidales bacterium]
MTKKIHIPFLLAPATVILMVSCADYLESDQYFKDRMTEEKVFADKTYSEQWLAHAYSFLTDMNADVCSKGNTPHCFADDMYYGDRDVTYDVSNASALSYSRFKLGEYNENEKQSWQRCYRGIRQAAIFIHNIHINEELTPEEIADYRGQARFVRAYFYWLLLRKYGPVPLLPDEGLDYTESYDELARPRNTFEECAEYISAEMILAAQELQEGHRDESNIARPTRGAALAARAKALLYAASPLANGNEDEFAAALTDDQGQRLLSDKYSEEKWARAAAAARDVMELGMYQLFTISNRTTGASESYPLTITPPDDGGDFSGKNWPEGWADIDPFESYRSIFNGAVDGTGNTELIFTRGLSGGEKVHQMVIHQLPSIATGWNTHGITQKQCDAYYMDDGTDCPGKDKEIGRGDGSNRATGYVDAADKTKNALLRDGVSKQYVDREPRFYASVAFNGCVWNLENESQVANYHKQVFYYRGEGNGYTNTQFWLRSGIGVKKFVHPSDTYENNTANKILDKLEPAIRYADILLMYAEALNELDNSFSVPSWDGSTTYAIGRDIDEMKKGVRPVRCRAGVPDYLPEVYEDKDLFRAKVKRERQIELMGEGQRYYDLRRWKDAPVEESLPIYGCNPLMTRNQSDLFHTPVPIWSFTTAFTPKMWFWPINHEELKRNNRLTQIPGWTYND